MPQRPALSVGDSIRAPCPEALTEVKVPLLLVLFLMQRISFLRCIRG